MLFFGTPHELFLEVGCDKASIKTPNLKKRDGPIWRVVFGS
jgi:hypothetical protein